MTSSFCHLSATFIISESVAKFLFYKICSHFHIPDFLKVKFKNNPDFLKVNLYFYNKN